MNSNHLDHDEGFTPNEDGGYGRPSKSALKRASHELQDLGEQLIAMPDSWLKDIDMPERLRDALDGYKTTRSFEGKRRQMQYIGKVLRLVEVDALREAVAAFQLGQAKDSLSLHEAERWRAELLADEKAALTRWVESFPETDVQQLRTLIRNAKKDAALEPEKRNGRGYRELFQFIKRDLKAQAKQSGAEVADDDHDEDES